MTTLQKALSPTTKQQQQQQRPITITSQVASLDPSIHPPIQPSRLSLEGDDIRMVELPEVSDVSLLDVSDLLDCHQFVVQLPQEDGTLCPAAQPQEIRYVFERDVPVVWNHRLSSANKLFATSI